MERRVALRVHGNLPQGQENVVKHLLEVAHLASFLSFQCERCVAVQGKAKQSGMSHLVHRVQTRNLHHPTDIRRFQVIVANPLSKLRIGRGKRSESCATDTSAGCRLYLGPFIACTAIDGHAVLRVLVLGGLEVTEHL